ncbi:transglutaminase domain-containing protein [Candidatus Woesearchaeota archaeon]|nr:transglutaminase domain-containing protein [Candidatus Woesearchaeota archaeon]
MLVTNIGTLQQQVTGKYSAIIGNTLYCVSTSRRATVQHPSLQWCGGTFSLEQAGTVDMYEPIFVRGQDLDAADNGEPEGEPNGEQGEQNGSQNERSEGKEEIRLEELESLSGLSSALEKIPKPTRRVISGIRSGIPHERRHRFPENYFIAPEGFYQLEEQQHPSWDERNYVQLGDRKLEIRRFAFSIDDLVEEEHRKTATPQKRSVRGDPGEQKAQPNIALIVPNENRSHEYNSVLLDKSVLNHFGTDCMMEQDAREAIRGKRTSYEKGRAIFDLIHRKVKYETATRWYKTAISAYHGGRGNCAETAAIFVGMARHVNLSASWAFVYIDCHGKDFRRERMGHACAVLKTERGDVHSDNAYYKYDAKHGLLEKKQDSEALTTLQQLFV